MGKAIGWIFRRLPETDDPQTRKHVVFFTIGLNLALMVGLIVSILYVASTRRYERNLCESQNHARLQADRRNAAIRAYLYRHDASSVANQITDPPTIDCHTGIELRRLGSAAVHAIAGIQR